MKIISFLFSASFTDASFTLTASNTLFKKILLKIGDLCPSVIKYTSLLHTHRILWSISFGEILYELVSFPLSNGFGAIAVISSLLFYALIKTNSYSLCYISFYNPCWIIIKYVVSAIICTTVTNNNRNISLIFRDISTNNHIVFYSIGSGWRINSTFDISERLSLAILFKKFLKEFLFRWNIDSRASYQIYIILSVRMYHYYIYIQQQDISNRL